MRKNYFIFFCLLFFFQLFGQDCNNKLAENKTDRISGNKILKSAFMSFKVNFSSNSTISFELKDRELKLISTSTLENINNQNNTLIFHFDNSETLKIKFDENYKSETINKQKVYFNETKINYDNLKVFSKQKLMKVELVENNEEIIVKEKFSNNIIEYTKCFFDNVDKEKDLGKKENNIDELKVPEYYKPCNIVTDKIDEFEGYRKRELHYAGIAKPTNPGFPLFINIISFDKELWMKAELDAISYCLNKESKISLKLEDNSIVKLSHIGDIDCGKRATFKVKFSETDKQNLKKSPIKIIRLETADGNIDLPHIMIKNYFIENIDCLK